MSDLIWKKSKVDHIIQNEWIDFREAYYILPDGKEAGPYYQYSRRSYSIIIAKTRDNKYLCVKQFRHGINQITTEFPAGGIETKGNEYDTINAEEALECAKRELLEETGYQSYNWHHLITVPSNATIADNYAYIFYAEDCEKVSELDLDDTEFLEVILLSFEEIEELIQNNAFQQAMHIMAWEYLKNKRF